MAETTNNIWVGIGYTGTDGGKTSPGGINLSYGLRHGNWGYEFGITNFAQYPSTGTTYSVDSKYVDKGVNDSYAYGINTLYFYGLNGKVTLFGGPGLYIVRKNNIVQAKNTDVNPVTGKYLYYDKYYTQSGTDELVFDVNAGVQYKVNKQFTFGIGYDLIRKSYIKFVNAF
jgi:hypothetical protein